MAPKIIVGGGLFDFKEGSVKVRVGIKIANAEITSGQEIRLQDMVDNFFESIKNLVEGKIEIGTSDDPADEIKSDAPIEPSTDNGPI